MSEPADERGARARLRRLAGAPLLRSARLWQALPVLLLAGWLMGVRRPLGYAPEWAWPIRSQPAPAAGWLIWLALGGAFNALIAVFLWRDRPRPRGRGVLGGLALAWLLLWGVAGGLLALSLSGPVEHWLVSSTWNTISNEYFSTAYEVGDLDGFLRSYPARMEQGHYHLRTHPPGSVLLYRLGIDIYEGVPGLRRAVEGHLEAMDPGGVDGLRRFARQFPLTPDLPRSAVGAAIFCSLGMLLVGFSGVVSVFLWQRTTAGRERAWWAAWALALTPALFFFGFTLDGALFGLAAAVYPIWERALGAERRLARTGLAAGAGLLWCLALSISLGALAMLPVLLLAAGLRRAGLRPLLEQTASFLAGALLPLLAAAALGVPVLAIAVTGLTAHRGVTVASFSRTYAIWLILNLVDVGLFAGAPVVVGALWSAARARRATARAPAVAWGWAVLATLLALDLSGAVRAEVGRIWMFLYPPLVAAWAGGAAVREQRWTVGWQMAQLALMTVWMPALVRPY